MDLNNVIKLSEFQHKAKKIILKNDCHSTAYLANTIFNRSSKGNSYRYAELKAIDYAKRNGLNEPTIKEYETPRKFYVDHCLYWDVIGTLRVYLLSNLPLAS